MHLISLPLNGKHGKGKSVVIARQWLDEVSKYTWRAVPGVNTTYAYTQITIGDGEQTSLAMHDLIMRPPKGMKVDHIDGDGLNNEPSNLRVVTHSQNMMNRRPNRNSSSKYKGVSWDKRHQKWKAKIRYNNKIIHLGSYDDEETPARVYDVFAIKYHGEYARLNFPDDVEKSIETYNNLPVKQTTSVYRGVSWDKRDKRWIVHIYVNRKQIHVGSFTDELEAAKAYDRAAIQYGCNLDRLNFTLEGEV